PALLALVLLFFVLFRTGSAKEEKKGEGLNLGEYIAGLWSLLKNKAVLGIALMAGFRSTAQAALRLFFPFYVAEVLNLSAAEAAGFAGLALTALNLGGSFAAIPAGMASDRYGRRPVVMWALALSTVFIFALSFLRDEATLVIGISLLGFSIYALRPVVVGWMMDIVPREMRGSGTNLMFTTQSMLQMVSPIVAGAIADVYGVVYVFYFCAALLLMANAVAFMLPKK
ncbi:MAG: MFS transporter, partial [Rhodospirillales bacterium]